MGVDALSESNSGGRRRIADSNRFSSFLQSDPKSSHHFWRKDLASASATASLEKITAQGRQALVTPSFQDIPVVHGLPQGLFMGCCVALFGRWP
jgi:hypothetical protein